MNSSNNHNNNHNHNDDDNDNDNDDDDDDDDDDNEIIVQKFYEQYSLFICTLLNYCTLVLSYFLNDKENIVAVLFHF